MAQLKARIGEKHHMESSADQHSEHGKESITFRIDKVVLEKLKQEAAQKEVSLNTLINQIAKHHTDWHSSSVQAGLISVRKRLIVQLIEKLGDEEIRPLAADIAKEADKEFIRLLRREYNIESALDLVEIWAKVSGFPYRRDTIKDSVHEFYLQHDMGRKWSQYLSELYRNLFEEFQIAKVRFDITDNTLYFTVDTESSTSANTGRSSHAKKD
jgi:predicted DNA binding CopG/RHH family protein/uncharacterized protein YihD (DUF1040 family)